MKLLFILATYLISIPSFCNEVKVSAHPDYPPITWESGGTLKGAAVELTKMALSNLGYKPVFTPVGTWGRAQVEVKHGRIDILLPPYKTPEREKWFVYPDKPFLIDRTIILTKKGRVIKFEKFEDLKKYEGIAIANDSFGHEFDQADKKHKLLKRFSKTRSCLEFLLKGRADYLIAGHNAVQAIIAKLSLEGQFTIQEQSIAETGMYTAISKKSKYNTKKFRDSFFKEIEKLVMEKRHELESKKALIEYTRETKRDLWPWGDG
ncbi:substrate-binding periplasmic protein [Halobacteriovorax sp.]|uniref:substrate-binding periplasmic protein n=1 Tax=Halobacteriovorax sp. TaxID=2020862 RepID=UPI00356A86D5